MKTIERVTNPSIERINGVLNSTESTGVEIVTRYNYGNRRFYIGPRGEEEIINFNKLDIPKLKALSTLLFRVDGLMETNCWIERDRAKMEIADVLSILEDKISSIVLQADHEGVQEFIMHNYAPGSNANIRSLGVDEQRNRYILIPSIRARYIAGRINEGRRVVIVDDSFYFTKTVMNRAKGNDSLHIITAQPEKVREYATKKGYHCD